MMIVKDIAPSEPLREYVQQYRIRHFVFGSNGLPSMKPFPPRPEQSLCFYVRGAETAIYQDGSVYRKPSAVLSGQFTSRVDRFVSYPETLMIMVDFEPGALYRLIASPFSAFADTDIDAELVMPAEIRNVSRRLNSTDDYAEMIGLIEDFLAGLLRKARALSPIDQILRFISGDPDQSLHFMTHKTCMSLRQLERSFLNYIGISPKTFLRVAQFNQTYWMHLDQPHMTWTQIAAACGYTDYQHLAKAYRQFANNTPSLFFQEEGRAPGRMLGLNKPL